ncbi:MAG: hypothetical protein ACFFCM_09680 [Promethearchaeota archaeon]
MIVDGSFELKTKEKTFYFDNKKNYTPPPFIGCLLSDKNGKKIASFEIYNGALDYFIKKNMKDESKQENFNIDLIPMFICALERFSEEINIQNVPCINFEGTNIKLHCIFNLDNFSVIFFLNPLVHIKAYEALIHNYFIKLYDEYRSEFQDIIKLGSLDFIYHLEILGMEWIRHLNDIYIFRNSIKKERS